VSPLTVDVPVETRPRTQPPGDRLPPLPPEDHGDGEGGSSQPSRPLLDNVRLAMVFFLSAETMLFGAFISGFFVLRLAAPQWPPPLQPRLPIVVTGINTFILMTSSAALIAAMAAFRRRDRMPLVRGMALTAALGALFLAVQGYEWARLIHYGLHVTSGAYGATFYTLIGLHAAHVIGALVWLLVVLRLAARGRFVDGRAGALRACAIYWHYVVALWPVLYVSVYLT
jgi:heme/copper-type cytochrome/quinol oxidase subunit 3